MRIPAQNEPISSNLDKIERNRLRFLRDLAVVLVENGVFVDGLKQPELLRGMIADTFLPALIASLDGTRTRPQIETVFSSVPREYLDTALSALANWGMIENPDDDREMSWASTDTLAFFRRLIAVSGTHESACGVYESLCATHVAVVIDPNEASYEILVSLLRSCGLRFVHVLTRDQLNSDQSLQSSLIVYFGHIIDGAPTVEEISGSGSETAWLRIAIDYTGEYADVGPLLGGAYGGCSSCFYRLYDDPMPVCRSKFRVPDHQLNTWLALVALEIMHIVALPALGLAPRHFRRYDLRTLVWRDLQYPTLPNCYRCRKTPVFKWRHSLPSYTNDFSYTNTALVYEEYVSLHSRRYLTPNDANEFKKINQELSRECKRMPSCPRVPLLRGDHVLEGEVIEVLQVKRRAILAPVTLDRLSATLALTAGIRDVSGSAMRRWSATAGNLGSVELFVVNRSMEDLQPGIYLYQPDDHSLALFRKRHSLPISEFMSQVLSRSDDDLPDVLILFTGAFHRLFKKYGPFAYHLMHLDAGFALGQFHLVSASSRMFTCFSVTQADALIQKHLNLRPLEELPTAVMEIWSDSQASSRRKQLSRVESENARFLTSAEQYRNADIQEITTMLMNESVGAPPSSIPYELILMSPITSKDIHYRAEISLPKPSRRSLSVGEVLTKRHSVRAFSQRPVRRDDIGTAFHYSQIADLESFHPADKVYPLTYFLLANNVSGVTKGIYVYDTGGHRLLQTEQSLSHYQIEELFVQTNFATAPAIVWIVGNMAAACIRGGAHGHGRLLARAGMAAHRLWTVAISLGLAGCPIAGLVSGTARGLLGIDGQQAASLFAVALGYPTTTATDDKKSALTAEF